MHQKVAVVIWAIDPKNQKRVLLRHNKPFNGYEDEWTITFGNIEIGEEMSETAIREIQEELGISKENILEVKNLNYDIKYDSKKHGLTQIKFFGIKVKDINVKIVLNEESIGYDWKTLKEAKNIMKHADESKSLDLI